MLERPHFGWEVGCELRSLSSDPYSTPAWSSFFSAQVSASAALTGLLFVAVSVNLTRILQFPQLAALTAKALTMLVGVLLTSTLCLVPGQSTRVLGVEFVVLGAVAWVAITRILREATKDNTYVTRLELFIKTTLTHAGTLPIAMCGVSLLFGRGGGLYWLVGSVCISYLGALLDAWVLLIEILR